MKAALLNVLMCLLFFNLNSHQTVQSFCFASSLHHLLFSENLKTGCVIEPVAELSQ